MCVFYIYMFNVYSVYYSSCLVLEITNVVTSIPALDGTVFRVDKKETTFTIALLSPLSAPVSTLYTSYLFSVR